MNVLQNDKVQNISELLHPLKSDSQEQLMKLTWKLMSLEKQNDHVKDIRFLFFKFSCHFIII